jgi:hypothetical protein
MTPPTPHIVYLIPLLGATLLLFFLKAVVNCPVLRDTFVLSLLSLFRSWAYGLITFNTQIISYFKAFSTHQNDSMRGEEKQRELIERQLINKGVSNITNSTRMEINYLVVSEDTQWSEYLLPPLATAVHIQRVQIQAKLQTTDKQQQCQHTAHMSHSSTHCNKPELSVPVPVYFSKEVENHCLRVAPRTQHTEQFRVDGLSKSARAVGLW